MHKVGFLDGDGEMAKLIRQYDWTGTSLGPIDQWPGNLRNTLGLLLRSGFPMFLFWGPDLICFYNDAFRPSLGAAGMHPLIGKKAAEAWAGTWHITGNILQEVLTTGKSTQFEDMPASFHRNGRLEETYWTFSCSPVTNDDGRTDGVFGVCVETTDKVKGRARLAESETRFRTMAENADILIAVADENGNATYLNEAWTTFTGRTLSEFLDVGWTDLIHPEDREPFAQYFLEALKNKTPFTRQFRVKKKDGDYGWMLAKGAVRQTPAGTFAGHVSVSIDITEQIRILQQVRESELDLRNIVMSAPIGICILDAATLVAEIVNDSFLEVAGKPREAIIGKNYWEPFAEARQYYESALAGVARDGKSFVADEVELMLIRHGREEWIFVSFIYAPIFDVSGQVKKIAVWVLENTNQVAARRRIEEAEKKAKLAITSANLGVYEIVYATDAMITDDRFKAIWGLGSADFSRIEYVRCIHPDDQAARQAAHQRSLRSGQLAYRCRVVWPDGSHRWVRITGTIIFDDQRSPLKIIGVAQDITDAILNQKRVEDSEKSIRTMILQAPVAMCILRGPAYRVSIANNKMIELWGKQPQDVLDKPIFEGLPEAKDQGLEALLDKVYTTGETFAAYERPVALPRDGKIVTVYIDFVYQALAGGDGQSKDILTVAIDVTYQILTRRKIEDVVTDRTKELAEANRHLERSNKELSQFAHITSHDLQEPIRKIATYASLLADEPGIDASAMNYIDKMADAAKRMQTLIRDILTYSELSRQAPAYQPVDLQQVIKDVLNEFDLLIEQKSATVHVEILPTIDAVPLQMTQLFSNLLSNALKYIPADTPPVIAITSRAEGSNFHIQFSDNGIGFAQEYAEQIFSIFQRLHRKEQYSGTGIGLAMCKKIVENHAGAITAVSSPGKGATFHIILPAHATKPSTH